MAPSQRSPEETLRALEQIEQRWRHALSLVDADDPVAAAREVAEADRDIEKLIDLQAAATAGTPEQLGRIQARFTELNALYRTLLERSQEGLQSLGRAMDQCREGARALQAYAPERNRRPQINEIL